MLRLIIEDGEGATHVVPLVRDEITIGREEGNTIRLTERNVSRRHARLLRTGEDTQPTVIVEDLRSYNGIKVNGDRVAWKRTLRPSDTLQIGDYFLALQSEHADLSEETDTPTYLPGGNAEGRGLLPEADRGRLIVVSSNLAGRVYWLDRGEMLIGRSKGDGNDLVINHRSISRNHAKIIHRDGAFTIIDLGSSNGLIVNGQSFDTTNLVNGDIIEVGHVKLRYSAPGDTYTFQPSDIDDVPIPARDDVPRVVVLALFLVVVALSAYILSSSLGDKQRSDKPIAVASTAVPTKGTVKANAETGNSVQRVEAQQLAPNKPKAEEQQVSELMSEAQDHLNAERWEEARAVFERVLQAETENVEARLGRKMAIRELENRASFNRLNGMMSEKKWTGALMLIDGFDSVSAYRARVNGMRSKVEQAFVEEKVRVAQTAISEARFDDAYAVQEELMSHSFGEQDGLTLKAKIEAALRAKARARAELTKSRQRATQQTRIQSQAPQTKVNAARSMTKTTRAKPKPSNSTQSYEEVLSLARQKHIAGQPSDAAKHFEKAGRMRPNAVNPPMALCNIYRKSKRLGAALPHCRRWYELTRNPTQKPKIKYYIDKIEKELQR